MILKRSNADVVLDQATGAAITSAQSGSCMQASSSSVASSTRSGSASASASGQASRSTSSGFAVPTTVPTSLPGAVGLLGLVAALRGGSDARGIIASLAKRRLARLRGAHGTDGQEWQCYISYLCYPSA